MQHLYCSGAAGAQLACRNAPAPPCASYMPRGGQASTRAGSELASLSEACRQLRCGRGRRTHLAAARHRRSAVPPRAHAGISSESTSSVAIGPVELPRDREPDDPEVALLKSINQEMSLLGRGPRWRQALAMFDRLVENGPLPNAFIATTAISIAGRNKQEQRAERIFAWLQARDPPSPATHKTYTALIQACGRAGNWRRCIEVFEMMEKSGIRPTKHTLSSLLAACSKGGTAGSAAVVKLFDRLVDTLDADAIDLQVLTALVSVFGSLRDSERAERVHEWACTQGVALDAHFYCALMTALTNGGKAARAVALFEECVLEPNVHCYTAAIRALGRTARWEEAERLFLSMGSKGLRPTALTFGCLLAAYEQSAQAAHALALLDRMRRATDPALRPTEVCFNSAMSACAKTVPPRWKDAVALVGEMKTGQFVGVAPSVVSYSTAVWACGLAGKHAEAFRLFEQMLADGVKPNDYTFSGLITAHSSCGVRRITELRQMMAAHGVAETVHTFNALIAAYDRCGAYEKALETFKQMKAEGIAPNRVTLQMMSLVGERGVSQIEAVQTNLAAFSAAAGVLGAALIRAGFM